MSAHGFNAHTTDNDVVVDAHALLATRGHICYCLRHYFTRQQAKPHSNATCFLLFARHGHHTTNAATKPSSAQIGETLRVHMLPAYLSRLGKYNATPPFWIAAATCPVAGDRDT